MSTNYVAKGANRPHADGKKARAGQKGTMLPPLSEERKAARAAAVAAAREELAARLAEKAASHEQKMAEDPNWVAAATWAQMATERGWTIAGLVRSGDKRRVSAIATRSDERLALSWEDAAPVDRVLHTDLFGTNHRVAFADVQSILDRSNG